MILCGDYYKY